MLTQHIGLVLKLRSDVTGLAGIVASSSFNLQFEQDGSQRDRSMHAVSWPAEDSGICMYSHAMLPFISYEHDKLV